MTTRETVEFLKRESGDNQGDCVVLRNSLSTVKEAVMSKGRVLVPCGRLGCI